LQRNLVGKLEGKKALARPGHKSEGNIKVIFDKECMNVWTEIT
jgi:hypothetical protein